MYPEMRDEQPIPETITISLRLMPSFSTARISPLSTIP
jgi:hypothetical protein